MMRVRGSGLALLVLVLSGAAGANERTPLARRTVKDLLESLEHPNPIVRIEAIDELGRRRDAKALVPLLLSLRDEVPEARAHAAEALRVLGDERAVPFLSRMLEDRDETVRCRAVLALGDLAGKYVLPTLTRMLKDPTVVVRAASVRALGEIGDPLSLEVILAMLETEAGVSDQAVAAAAVIACAKIKGVEGLSKSLRVVEEDLAESWFLRASVAHAVGVARDRGRTPFLIELLEADEHPRVCQAAAGALGSLGETEPLMRILEHEDPFRRQAAVGGLSDVPGDEARSALVGATRDESPGVVLSAAAVLVDRGVKEALPVLIGLLEADAQIWLGALEILEMRTGMAFGRNPPRWMEWFTKNRDRLVFDPESGLFTGGR